LQKVPVYLEGDDIKGKVLITVNNKGKKLDHAGVRVELVGLIENCLDKQASTQFLNIGKDLEPPGSLFDSSSYEFNFSQVEFPWESYVGLNMRVRYFINVIINRSTKITKEEDLIV
jgi:vacuolar protein sorting-associated protein 26